jgi:hypothetical protein
MSWIVEHVERVLCCVVGKPMIVCEKKVDRLAETRPTWLDAILSYEEFALVF